MSSNNQPPTHTRRAHPALVDLAPTTTTPGPHQPLQTTRTQPLTWPSVTASTVAVLEGVGRAPPPRPAHHADAHARTREALVPNGGSSFGTREIRGCLPYGARGAPSSGSALSRQRVCRRPIATPECGAVWADSRPWHPRGHSAHSMHMSPPPKRPRRSLIATCPTITAPRTQLAPGLATPYGTRRRHAECLESSRA